MGDGLGDSGRREEARGEAPRAHVGRGARPTVLLLLLLAVTVWAWWEYQHRIPAVRPNQAVARLETRQEVVEHEGKTIRVVYDLPYSYRPGVPQDELAMDLFIPEHARAKNRPVLVYLHGGGWIGGNKNGIGPKSLYFASRGILVASVNYRLCYPRPGRNGAIDVADAIRFLHREVGSFGGDPERMFIMGHSAGAHLGALAICDAEMLANKDPAAFGAIRGAIFLDGSGYDVLALMHSKNANDFKAFFGNNPTDWEGVSPYRYAVGRTGLPAMMLVHAGGEPVRKMVAERLADALRSGGSAAVLVDMPDRDHYSLDGKIGEKDDPLTPEIERFIAEDGKLQ